MKKSSNRVQDRYQQRKESGSFKLILLHVNTKYNFFFKEMQYCASQLPATGLLIPLALLPQRQLQNTPKLALEVTTGHLEGQKEHLWEFPFWDSSEERYLGLAT